MMNRNRKHAIRMQGKIYPKCKNNIIKRKKNGKKKISCKNYDLFAQVACLYNIERTCELREEINNLAKKNRHCA